MTPAKKDKLDHIIEEAIDHWEGRAGVALALAQLAPLANQDQVQHLVKFFVPEALGDRNPEVANLMLEAATALIDYHGEVCTDSGFESEYMMLILLAVMFVSRFIRTVTLCLLNLLQSCVTLLLPVFEKCLKSAPNHASFDCVRQSVIVLMGSLAKHLDPTNAKIKPIVAKLVEALSTPSQPVRQKRFFS